MPDHIEPAAECPDQDCRAPIGRKHGMGCRIAICVTTGQQRLLHERHNPPPNRCVDIYPGEPVEAGTPMCHRGCGIPTWRHAIPVDAHTCGEDVWTGWLHGTAEAIAHGLFVRPAGDGDPAQGWIPCDAATPGARPDLDRVYRTGTWNPIRQTWEVSGEATSHA